MSQAEHQCGAVLLLSLVFALLLALLTTMVVQTATQQLQMASNAQMRRLLQEYALSVTAALSRNPHNFLLDTGVAHINCMPASQQPDCDSKALAISALELISSERVVLEYRVVRRAPLHTALPRPDAQDKEVGRDAFFATFDVEVRVTDGRAIARVVQGIAVDIAHPLKRYRTYWREPGVDPL